MSRVIFGSVKWKKYIMWEMEGIRGHLHEVFHSTNVNDWLILLRAGSSYFHDLGKGTSSPSAMKTVRASFGLGD